MFEGLQDRLDGVFKTIKGQGKLTEANVEEALRAVRRALLEADVNFKVTKKFIDDVRVRAMGQEVLQSITPGQQMVKVVHDELVNLMGSSTAGLNLAGRPPVVLMMIGLQGSGKTTATAKLAMMLRKKNRKVLMAACDIYRPAAVDQLVILGKQLEIPVHTEAKGVKPPQIATAAVARAKEENLDTVIIDTAGRLHIDQELMDELQAIRKLVGPQEILLVVDSMTGQDAVNVAQGFVDQVGIDGVIMTKLDGDARGGAALSLRAVTGKPIKFIGTGEKMTDLEPFHPDRMASRILGMGDVLTLVEKAQEEMDAKKAEKLQEKILKQQFTLEDFLDQIHQLKKMGSMDQLLAMIPGGNKLAKMQGAAMDDSQMKKVESIIQSMTVQERRNPEIIGGSRKNRIARGSGNKTADVNQLLRQFKDAKKMMKQMTTGRMGKMMKKGMLPFG